MLCFKGTVSQDILLQVFFMNLLPPSLWKSTNLGTFVGHLRIWDLWTQYFLQLPICCRKFIADLQLPQIWEFFILLLTNTYLKCSNSNFYQIKNSGKQTCRWLLDSFAIKGGNFLKRCLILSVLWWKIFGFAICGLAHQQNLQIWICGSIKRNLRTRISQKFADLWLRIKPKNLQI